MCYGTSGNNSLVGRQIDCVNSGIGNGDGVGMMRNRIAEAVTDADAGAGDKAIMKRKKRKHITRPKHTKVELPKTPSDLRECPKNQFIKNLPIYPQNDKVFEKEKYEDPLWLDSNKNTRMQGKEFPKLVECSPRIKKEDIIFQTNQENKLTNPYFSVIIVREVKGFGAIDSQGEFFYCNKDGTLFGQRINHAISSLGQYLAGDDKLRKKFQSSYIFVKTPNGKIYFVDLRTGEKTIIDREKDQLSLQYDGKEVDKITINNSNDFSKAKISIIKG